mgnify:CR=1 FL=1
MTFRQYIMLMTIGTFLAACAWLFVVFRVDPITTGLVGRLIFFITLSMMLVGLFSTVGVGLRVILFRVDLIVHREVVKAFRHAVFFTSLIIANLILATFGFLRWWTMLLLILFFSLFELFFWTTKRQKINTPTSIG